MKKLLITGGAGFIGSNFIKYIIGKYNNYKIVNLDILTYAGNLENLKEIENHQNYVFVKGDIADRKLINKLFEEYHFDYVINFAAESHVDRSIEDPEVFIRTNVMGTQVLLDVAKNTWTIGKDNKGYPIYQDGVKYLQISTDEVYGELGAEGKFSEDTPLAPNSPYSASKASADMITRAYYKTYGMPINITRCSNNYGPHQHREKLIPKIITNALENKKIPIYGDGLNIRDWIYVEDHCRALDVVLHSGRIGEIYNIGGENEITNIDLVKEILNLLEKSHDLIEFVEDRLGHDWRYAIDNTKIIKELGWKIEYGFKLGIENSIYFYQNNKNK